MIPIGEPHPKHPQLIATDRVEHGYQIFDGPGGDTFVCNDDLRWSTFFADQVRKDDLADATPEVIAALIAAEAALEVRLSHSGVLKEVKAALDKAIGIRQKPEHIKRAEAKHADS